MMAMKKRTWFRKVEIPDSIDQQDGLDHPRRRQQVLKDVVREELHDVH